MKHYLITRYNIKIPEWRGTDKSGQPTLDESWMQHRWELFQTYTVASVRKQTATGFTWLLLCDESTPTSWRKKLEAVSQVLYVRNWLPDLQTHLKSDEWLATTRLDNDDMIAPEFMETVIQHSRPVTHFLNITNGHKLIGGQNKKIMHAANPFITYIEPGADARSVYFTPHGVAMRKHAPIVQIDTKPLWTRVVHGRNYVKHES